MRYLLIFLAMLPASANAAWHRAVSNHFIVYGDTDSVKLQSLVERVEKFDATLRGLTGQVDEVPPNKLTIFVVRSVQTLQRLKGRGSKDVYGYYSPNITGSYVVVPLRAGSGAYDLNSETVLFHEYAHHFMLQYFAAGYPAWYVEGFAEYYSTTEFRKDGTIAAGMPAKHRFVSLVLDKPFPLTRMFASDVGRMTQDETSAFYSRAWLLTHYLRFDPARKDQMGTYLRKFAKGTPPMEAATDAFGDIKQLEAELQGYVKAKRMSYISFRIKLPEVKVAIERLSDAESALMPLHIRFIEPHDDVEAAVFVADARAMSATYPKEPRALEALAEGELDVMQLTAATTANDALLAMRPTDTRALLRRARIATAQMQKTNDFPGGWKAIRSLIVKANRTAPDDPFPLAEYFDSYMREGIAVSDSAAKGLNRAVELSPQTVSLRFTLANYLISKSKMADAKYILQPLLNHPHSTEVSAAARAMLDKSYRKPNPAPPNK